MAKRPYDKKNLYDKKSHSKFLRRSVLTVECTYAEMFLRRDELTAKCPHDEKPSAEMSHGKNSGDRPSAEKCSATRPCKVCYLCVAHWEKQAF